MEGGRGGWEDGGVTTVPYGGDGGILSKRTLMHRNGLPKMEVSQAGGSGDTATFTADKV